MKNLRYLLESLVVRFGLWFFGSLSLQTSADLAAKIARLVGKKIAVQKLAYRNLSNAIPSLSEVEKEKILDEMWSNLGRIVGEFPHVMRGDVDALIEASEESLKNLAEMRNLSGGIIVSGHLGNWEVGPRFLVAQGIKVSTVYRPLNNPYVERMIAGLRQTKMIEKNAGGNRKIVESVRRGEFVIILADQKISEGEPVKFFHADAITTTSIARIALRYKVPVIPARVVRVGGRFNVEVEKPLAIPSQAEVNSAALPLTLTINQTLERWIREYPAQWFWVHDRWKE
ncbi:MAG: hypothetical protein FJX34_03760 [Alphaproteobacteria bacterium]|nr:hypothetical protein [Alphaproteobacteria bacterium]